MKVMYFLWNNFCPWFIKDIFKIIILKYRYSHVLLSRFTISRLSIFQLLNHTIQLSDYVSLYEVSLQWNIKIGKYTYINWPNSYLLASEKYPISIGNYCSLAFDLCMITTNDHIISKLTMYPFLEHTEHHTGWEIKIWHGVWIGARVMILPWVTIGNGAVIWAWSIIRKDVPPYAIVIWNPAQIIRYRFDEAKIWAIESSKWWEWDREKVKENYNFEFLKI